jgi:hypothetical protein
VVTSQKLATTIATTRHHTRPALQTNKTDKHKAELLVLACSGNTLTLAGNIFCCYVMAALRIEHCKTGGVTDCTS